MRLLGACVILAAGAAVAFAQEPVPDEADQPDSTVPALEAPFDENPFDITGSDALSEESELDTLSRTSTDPFPSFDQPQERKPISVTLRALDKITARYTDIVAPIGAFATFNALEILPRFCDKRPPEEFPETTAFLEIFDRDLAAARASGSAQPVGAKGAPEAAPAPGEDLTLADRLPVLPASEGDAGEGDAGPLSPNATALDPARIFSGWMFASSPGLNSLEHPVYDVWVIDCKTEAVESEEPAL